MRVCSMRPSIGRATATALHELGAKVVVPARSVAAFDAFVDEHPGSTAMQLCDLLRHNQINYLGALHLLDAVVPRMLAQALDARTGQRGHISLMGSVAGYHGLPRSLAYGPPKAALINLTETLYLELPDKGLGVWLINPGFIDTPLTAQNEFTMPALISPDRAAKEILHGWARGEFDIRFPKRFTRWMKALQLLPYAAFFAATRRPKQT